MKNNELNEKELQTVAGGDVPTRSGMLVELDRIYVDYWQKMITKEEYIARLDALEIEALRKR